MPQGRSTFAKRKKEQIRQQKQQDKTDRKNQRKQEKTEKGSVNELAELRVHAAEQARLFQLGSGQEEAPSETPPSSSSEVDHSGSGE
jgi:hypothetical protein